MVYTVTMKIDGDQMDSLVVNNLKETYEDCIKTLTNTALQVWDPIEDAEKRYEGLKIVLGYYMAPAEYQAYIKKWERYLKAYVNEKVKTSRAAD
jgi:hypothetical protein